MQMRQRDLINSLIRTARELERPLATIYNRKGVALETSSGRIRLGPHPNRPIHSRDFPHILNSLGFPEAALGSGR